MDLDFLPFVFLPKLLEELGGAEMPSPTKTLFDSDGPVKLCGDGDAGCVGGCANLLLFASEGEGLLGFISISE